MEGNEEASYQAMRAKVVEELKKNFKPEFLNRVDETIVFPQLNQDELMQIVGLFIKRLGERMLDRDMTVSVSPMRRRSSSSHSGGTPRWVPGHCAGRFSKRGGPA
jgi:ATP-dependent Clp protease ATP-binding subunit ClpA